MTFSKRWRNIYLRAKTLANISIVDEYSVADIARIRTKFGNTLDALKRLRINGRSNLGWEGPSSVG